MSDTAHDTETVDALRRMEEIRARNRYLTAIPFETHGPGIHGDNCPPCGMVRSIADVQWLLEQFGEIEWGARWADQGPAETTASDEASVRRWVSNLPAQRRAMWRRAASDWRDVEQEADRG